LSLSKTFVSHLVSHLVIQVEGAWNISRGLSIWDVFSHTPGKTANGDTGDVADDNYDRFLGDITLMKNIILFIVQKLFCHFFFDGGRFRIQKLSLFIILVEIVSHWEASRKSSWFQAL
jgi:hypothetical protein